MKSPFEMTQTEMTSFGYKIVDEIVQHYTSLNTKKPVSKASRTEMDALFLQEAPEQSMPAEDVLRFVMKNVIPNSNISTHPKSFSFVPSPSNFVSTMADALATGFNIFSGGWMLAPAAAELEIVTMNLLLKIFDFPVKRGGGIYTSGGSLANLTANAAAAIPATANAAAAFLPKLAIFEPNP